MRLHFTTPIVLPTWSAAALPPCSAPGLCAQLLCSPTPRCLSRWGGRGRQSRRQPVPPARTRKTPGDKSVEFETTCHSAAISRFHKSSRNREETLSKQCRSWAISELTCSSSSFVTEGNRLRTVRAAVCVAKLTLICRFFRTLPSSSAFAISASVRVSWKTQKG